MEPIQARQSRLVVFDVEGVLIPKNRFMYGAIKSLGIAKTLKALLFGALYLIGILPLSLALKLIFRMMRGVHKEKLVSIAASIPLMPNVEETIHSLKNRGDKIAIISSGLPDFIVRDLAYRVDADYASGFELGLDDAVLSGTVKGDVIERDGKKVALSAILGAENLATNDCVVVADDRNNISMFNSCMLKIGYNPDFITRLKSDDVVIGDLRKILPILEGRKPERSLPSKNDFVREIIHLSAICIPMLIMLFGLVTVALLIFSVVMLYAASELARMEGKKLPVISQITNFAASHAERYEFAAAPIYFALGILLSLFLFPAPLSSGAIAIFAAGDSCASLVGGFSRTPLPFNKGKSLEGSIAGFFFAFLAGSLFVAPWMALVSALIAMTIEAIPLPINDNILMPLSAGLTLTFLH